MAPRGTNAASAKSAVLSKRALNRALLARQQLLVRSTLNARALVEHLVGMQAQAPEPPYIGLWSRVADFDPEELSSLIERREAVRIALMRSTIHLVTASDALYLRAVVQGVLDRGMKGSYARQLDGLHAADIETAARALLSEGPLTFADIGAGLAAKWPGRDPGRLAIAARQVIPLVQVPPRGLWRRSGAPMHDTVEAWLGRAIDVDHTPDEMVLRYLGAFGPASVMDVQAWSGLTRMGPVLERLRPGLVTFRNEHGRELFDLPEAPRPAEDESAPVRLLPQFDNALLSHADRTRIISDAHRKRTATLNGMVPGAVLVDGFFTGEWRSERRRGSAAIVVLPYARMTRKVVREVEGEAIALLSFLSPDAKHEVRFAE